MGIIRNVQTDTMAIADKLKHLIKNTAKCIAIKKKIKKLNKQQNIRNNKQLEKHDK